MEIVAVLVLLVTLGAAISILKLIKKMCELLQEMSVEVSSLRSFLDKRLPVSMDELSITEITKEVQRREAFLSKSLDMVSNAVAIGISRAFKR